MMKLNMVDFYKKTTFLTETLFFLNKIRNSTFDRKSTGAYTALKKFSKRSLNLGSTGSDFSIHKPFAVVIFGPPLAL